MTTTIVVGTVMLNTGEIVNLQSSMTDGTEGEVKTSGTVGAGGGIAATSIGTYADGKAIVGFITPMMPTATNVGEVQYAYLARRGEILRCLPVGYPEQTNMPFGLYQGPIQLQAGDTIRVLTGKAAAELRQVNYNVVASDGTNAIFSAQPSTATSGSTSLTHILSGQSLGQSLTGRQIVNHYSVGLEGLRYAGGSLLLVNDRGLPAGATVVCNVQNNPMESNMVGTAVVQLNWEAQVVAIA